MSGSKNRITKTRYDQVLWSRVCPNCGDYTIVDIHRRSSKDVMNQKGSKYLGWFHSCASPNGNKCWYMTPYVNDTRPLYEHFGEKTRD